MPLAHAQPRTGHVALLCFRVLVWNTGISIAVHTVLRGLNELVRVTDTRVLLLLQLERQVRTACLLLDTMLAVLLFISSDPVAI